jgi:hypothetical protein
MGDVTFSLDRLVDVDGRIAITLPDVTPWTLTTKTTAQLRNRI